MRITGLATGLDMDKIVGDSMKPYRIKIDQTQQKRDIVEMKQQLYRDVINDSKNLYNKYFDISKEDSILLSKNWATTSFESSNDAAVSVKGLAGGKVGNYKVNVSELATVPKTTLVMSDFTGKDTVKIDYNGKSIQVDIAGLTDEKEIAKKLNTELSSIGMKAEYSSFAKGIIIESKETGKTIGKSPDEKPNTFDITVGVATSTTVTNPITGKDEIELINTISKISSEGKNLKATIEGSSGTITYDDNNVLRNNKVSIDGIEFAFNDITTSEVRVTGKIDTKSTVDKIVGFVNDYNTLMEKLNTMTSDKRNKNYMPLTADQKKEMSETEIKLWNEKTKQGQLYRDSDVTRIVNKMKEAMRPMAGAGIDMESIGISPVKDYGNKNGTFTIDIDKLTKSLENNSEEVMNFFIGTPPAGTPENQKPAKTGVFQKMKTVLYDESITVSSNLIKKAGIEGSTTSTNNELTKSIEKYNKKMSDMEKDFKRREQALYSKYARLEVSMNKYNSQQGMMAQQFGGQ